MRSGDAFLGFSVRLRRLLVRSRQFAARVYPASLFTAPGNREETCQVSIRNGENRQKPAPDRKISLPQGISFAAARDTGRQGEALTENVILKNPGRRSAAAAGRRGRGRPAARGSSGATLCARTIRGPARARPTARRRDSRGSTDAPPR